MSQSPRISQHHGQRGDQQPHRPFADRRPWTDRAQFRSPSPVLAHVEESASNHSELLTSAVELSANMWVAFEQLEEAQIESSKGNSTAYRQQHLQNRLLIYAFLREIYLLYTQDRHRVRYAKRFKDTERYEGHEDKWSVELMEGTKRYFRPDGPRLSRFFEYDARSSCGDARLYTCPLVTEESKTAAMQNLRSLGREYLDHEQFRESLRAEHVSCKLLIAAQCFHSLHFVELKVRDSDGITYTECYPEVWLGFDKSGRIVRSSPNHNNLGNRSSAIYPDSAAHRHQREGSIRSFTRSRGRSVVPSIE